MLEAYISCSVSGPSFHTYNPQHLTPFPNQKIVIPPPLQSAEWTTPIGELRSICPASLGLDWLPLKPTYAHPLLIVILPEVILQSRGQWQCPDAIIGDPITNG